MFNLIGFGEIIVILIISLIFIGPKQIPSIARNLGRLIAKIKYFSNYVQNNFYNYLNNDELLKSLNKSAQELKQEINDNFEEIKNIQYTSNDEKNNKQNFDENYINQKTYNNFHKKSLYLQSLQQRKNLIKNINFTNRKKYKKNHQE